MKPLLFTFVLMFSQMTLAFNDLGHKMVAHAAWLQLTPYAKQNVERILGVGKNHFIQASVWADHIKSNEAFNYLKPLHYVNLPKTTRTYQASRDCKKNKCVVEAINDFSQILKTGSEKEQVLALRMVIHLIADIHQPLHAGLFEDRGGNWYEIKYQGKTINLHKFWDNHLVKRFAKDPESGANKLVANDVKVDVLTPKDWAQESHGIVLDYVYQVKEFDALNEAYLTQADAIMAKQLGIGAWRLAMWLNKLW